MFLSTVLTLLIGTLGTVLVVLVFRDLAGRIGLADLPDSRKRHEGDIPLVGGIAIFIAFAICMVSLRWR